MPFIHQRLLIASIIGLSTAYAAPSIAFADGFTAEQAVAGEKAYNSSCARCHGAKLEGGEAPELAGLHVMQNWDTAGGLYDFISVAMPPEEPGALGEETYLNIVAYVMSFNGAQPGSTPMVLNDSIYALSLAEQTQAGAAAATPPSASTGSPAAPTAVPQAYTWGKELPGTAPAATAEPKVPQAFTFGKELPQFKAP